MENIVFITGNQNKADFLAKWLGMSIEHQKIDLDEIQSLDSREIVARKACAAYEIVGQSVLVEDVSLTFSALNQLPGTLIKWFLEGSSLEAMCRILDGFTNRSATAKVTYGLIDGKKSRYFDGAMNGTIAEHPVGAGGFGFDAIFINDGQTKTRAKMNESEYVASSYRTAALKKLKAFLELAKNANLPD